MNNLDKRKRDFEVEILDKWSKRFLWWDRYYFSIKFLGDIAPKYSDMPVSRATWTAFKVGNIVALPMYQNKDNGLWYPL